MRGKNDCRLDDGIDLFDGSNAEVFHLAHDTLVVHDLPENGSLSPLRRETFHLQVGDSHSGAETVLCCALNDQTSPL